MEMKENHFTAFAHCQIIHHLQVQDQMFGSQSVTFSDKL
jgi:hypothetical protein